MISFNGNCRFPARERPFLLMETTVPFKGTGISSEATSAPRKHTEITTECDEDNNCSLYEKNLDGRNDEHRHKTGMRATFALIPATTLATIPETTMNKGMQTNC